MIPTVKNAEINIYQSFLEGSHEAFIQMDEMGCVDFWNRQAEITFGWKSQEVMRRPLGEIIIPERFRVAHEAGLKRFLLTGVGPVLNKTIELAALHRNGHEISIAMKISAIRDKDSRWCFGTFITDLSKTRQIEMEKQKSEESFRALVQGVQDYAIFMLDVNGFITSWNGGAEKINGYTETEILGRHFSCFYTPDAIREKLPERELEIAKYEGRYEEEGIRLRKNGEPFWANILITALRDSSGNLKGFAKVTRDITEKKNAQQKLQQAYLGLERIVEERTLELHDRQKQLSLIADAIPAYVGQFDTEHRILFLNRLHKQWLGIHESDNESFLGKSIFEFIGEERKAAVLPIFEAARNGVSNVFEHSVLRDGKFYYFHFTTIPEFSEAGVVQSYIVVSNDITQHRMNEHELTIAKQQAETANIAKTTFLAHMSHELRTPLGAVIGFSEILSNLNLQPEYQQYISAIRRNGDLLLNIIGGILDLSKIETGNIEIDKKLVSLPDLLRDIYTLLNLRAVDKKIDLFFTADGLIPDMIETDELRLKQILINLIGNAIKFTEKGRVTLKVKLVSQANEDFTLEFLISDTGIGLKLEQIERLFKPFSQADSTTKRKYGGSGLGLVLSRELARKLGGDLNLSQSQFGVGSEFRLTINPGTITQEQLKIFNATSLIQGSHLPAVVSRISLAGLKILVVDDAPDNRFIIHRFLSSAGAEVVEAENGKDALEKVSRENFDAMLLDLEMPVMDGFDTIYQMRANGIDLYTIALTAHAFKEIHLKCINAGFNEYISKPVLPSDLLEKIQQHVQKNITKS